MDHPDVALLRQRLKVTAESGLETVFDPPLQAALVAFQRERRMAADGLVGRGTRTALNGDAKAPVPVGSEAQRLIVNMERWRWMPERLGSLHVLSRENGSWKTITAAVDHLGEHRQPGSR